MWRKFLQLPRPGVEPGSPDLKSDALPIELSRLMMTDGKNELLEVFLEFTKKKLRLEVALATSRLNF